MKTQRIALYGILTSLILILGFLEHQFVLVPSVPGIKLGLSNIGLLFALCLIGSGGAWLLMVLKVLLSGLLFSGVTSMFYAFAGGVLSMLAMTLAVRIRGMGFVGISVCGAVFHMIGQVLMSRLLLGTWAAAVQLPLLLAAGVITGVLTGIAAGATCRAVSARDKTMRERLLSLGLDSPRQKT